MWLDAPFTWKEGCVIEKLVGYGTTKVRDRIKKLTEDEKEVIIGLFFRLEVDEIVFENRANKHKNNKVKIKKSICF
jgi:DNA replication initiation complex subunit (GINS family)